MLLDDGKSSLSILEGTSRGVSLPTPQGSSLHTQLLSEDHASHTVLPCSRPRARL